MAKINLIEDILRHDDADIIEFAADQAKLIRATLLSASKENAPEKLYSISGDLGILTAVLVALDRRNKERGLK